jgi:TonB family protein
MLFFLNTFDKHFPLKNKSLLTIFSSTMILSSRIYSVPPLFLPERIPLHTMRYHLIVTYPNQTSDTQSHIYKKVFGIAACVIAIIGITIVLMFKPQSVSQPHVLKTIAVLPEGGQMPIFNGNGDINDFLRWVMTNIQYPKGLEDKPARVVINFTVQKDGTLGLFKVLEAPKEKAYEQTVIELLKKSPHWKPARLSDGEEVNMEFTLPVVFTPEVRKK